MAFLGQTFSAQELPQDQGSFDPIPAGWYTATIAGAELRQTKAGTGEYIAVQYNVTGPTHEGRVVFGNLNIRNPNPKAEEIGLRQLGDIMRCIGLASVQDTDQLIGGTLQIKVSIKTDPTGQYEPSNEVKGFKTAGNAAPQAQAPAQQQAVQQQQAAPQQQAPASNTPPWMKQ